MKIAIPTRNGQVDDHFGHCEYFTVYTVEEKEMLSEEIVPSLQGCGCKSDIVSELKTKGVDIMLAGNMGQGAYNKVMFADIKVIRGCRGETKQVIADYLEGKVKDSLILCGTHEHHHHGHDHGHQCQH
ncbi:MAG: NifB/NifX family molybdenum-iron cluster-binding protein [Salinivirgaceae bacterium]|nr:NifB/NifX family molybdenum-iron cluster-binding protein [Salinivirgaceae bacterium]